MTKHKQNTSDNKHLLKRFVAYYKPHKATFAADMICSFIFSVSGLIYPIVSQRILRQSIPNGVISEVLILCAILLSIYLLRAGMKYYINYYGHVMGVKMQAAMRTDLFKHLEKLPYSFYDNNETGQLMTRMTNDLFDVSELAHHGPENFFITTFVTIGSFAYLCTISWKLSLIVFAFLPVLFIIAIACRKNMNKAFRKSREEIGNINATLENSIAGIRVTKAYANAEYEQEKFEKNNAGYVKARSKAYKAMGTFSASMSLVTEIYNVIVLLAGALFCIYDKEHFDYVDLVSFMISINLFISPVQTLIQFFEQLQDGVTGFRRFIAIMDVPVELESPTAHEVDNLKGDIVFKDVSFAYNHDKEVLDNINLTIPDGKMYAFVGASGGGKTTLCHLIPKFYPLEDGMIYIGGGAYKRNQKRFHAQKRRHSATGRVFVYGYVQREHRVRQRGRNRRGNRRGGKKGGYRRVYQKFARGLRYANRREGRKTVGRSETKIEHRARVPQKSVRSHFGRGDERA